MFTHVWKRLFSPNLVPSSITLHTYDGRPSKPLGLYQFPPLELGVKRVLLDIEVVDAQVDCNNISRHSYMYTRKAVSSLVYNIMIFPHNGKIVTLDQLKKYNMHTNTNTNNVLPSIGSTTYPQYVEIGLVNYKYFDLLGT